MVLLCFLVTNTTETPGSITVVNSRQKQVPLQLSGKGGCSTDLGTENPCQSCLLFLVEFTVIEEYVLREIMLHACLFGFWVFFSPSTKLNHVGSLALFSLPVKAFNKTPLMQG